MGRRALRPQGAMGRRALRPQGAMGRRALRPQGAKRNKLSNAFLQTHSIEI